MTDMKTAIKQKFGEVLSIVGESLTDQAARERKHESVEQMVQASNDRTVADIEMPAEYEMGADEMRDESWNTSESNKTL